MSQIHNNAQYEYVLFDLDGTLTDPGIGITNSVAYALRKFGIDTKDRTSLYKFIGPPLIDSFQKYYGFSIEQSEKAIEYYREYFADKGLFENAMYVGIDKLLENLKKSGKKIILATSKPEVYAVKILEYFNLDEYFTFMAGATMDGSRIRKGDIIKYAISSNKIDNLSRVIMIGDREHDIFGAKQAGVDSIGVLFGYGNYEELTNAGATYIAEKVSDIQQILI